MSATRQRQPKWRALDLDWIKRSKTTTLWDELNLCLGQLEAGESVYLGKGDRMRTARWCRLIAAELKLRGFQQSLF